MMFSGPLFPDWPFRGLEPHAYGLIMADPAWSFDNWSEVGEKKNPKAHYRCMPLEDIKSLPVVDLAARDCLIWLWATWPMLPHAIETLAAWGFAHSTGGEWRKVTKNGKSAFGPGYRLRTNSEPYLIGTRGNPPIGARNLRNGFDGLIRAHSQKPEESYERAERMAPGVRRVELFSRTNRPGWDCWGDEAGKFGDAA